MQLIIRRFLRT